MPDSSADRDPLERLAEEFVARYRRGERPAIEDFARRHPDLAADIRDLFPALVEMEQLKPVTGEHTGAFTPAAEPTDPVRVGEFRILRRVGVGGMGVVFEAVQESLGRHVALKLLPAETLVDPRRLERFRREAKAAARLHHTNIVPVFGTGEADGRHFYAMQFIDGHPLDAVIDEVRRLKERSQVLPAAPRAVSEVAAALVTGTFAHPAAPAAAGDAPRPAPAAAGSGSTSIDSSPAVSGSMSGGGSSYWTTVARVGAQVADALAYAHGQGVLHRDIKPANLLLDLRGTVWVTDFGLAKATDADDLTHAGDIVGTLRYMAPERFDGAGDARADVYALGLTLYELLTLAPAFHADNRAKLVEQVVAASPPRPRAVNPQIPRDLETIVLKAIARDPALRYPSAREMADDLTRFVEDRPIRARRVSRAEQAWRWCRRNPAVASLAAAVLVVLATGAGVSAYFAAEAERGERAARESAAAAEAKAREAREAAAALAAREAEARDYAGRLKVTAEEARDERDKVKAGEAQLRSEQDRSRRLFYASWLRDASAALAEGRPARVFEVLAETAPRPGDAPAADVRGWEWHYLARLADTGRQVRTDSGDNPDPDRPVRLFGHTSADGRWLVAPRRAGGGFVLDVYDAVAGKVVAQVPKAGAPVLPLPTLPPLLGGIPTAYPVLSADGKHLMLTDLTPANAEGFSPARPRVWVVATGDELPGPPPLQIRGPVSAGDLRLASGAAATTFFGPEALPVALGPGGAWVAWLEWSQTKAPGKGPSGTPARIEATAFRWDRATGKVGRKSFTPGAAVGKPVLSPDAETVHWKVADRPTARGAPPTGWGIDARLEYTAVRWDLRPEAPTPLEPKLALAPGSARSGGAVTALSPDRQTLATVVDRRVTVFKVGGETETWQADLPAGAGTSDAVHVAVSNGGRRVLVARPNAFVLIDEPRLVPGAGATARPEADVRSVVIRDITGPAAASDGTPPFRLTAGGTAVVSRPTRDGAYWVWDAATGLPAMSAGRKTGRGFGGPNVGGVGRPGPDYDQSWALMQRIAPGPDGDTIDLGKIGEQSRPWFDSLFARSGIPPLPESGIWTKEQYLAHLQSKPLAPLPRAAGDAAPEVAFVFPTFYETAPPPRPVERPQFSPPTNPGPGGWGGSSRKSRASVAPMPREAGTPAPPAAFALPAFYDSTPEYDRMWLMLQQATNGTGEDAVDLSRVPPPTKSLLKLDLERVGSPPPDAGVWTKAQFLAHVRSKPVAPMPREVGAAAPPATFPFPTFADGPGPPVGRFAPVNKGGSPQLQWVPDARGEPTQLRWSVVGTEGRKELVVRDGAAAYTLGWPFDTAPTPVALGGGRLLVRARTTWGLHALDQPGPMRRLAGSSNPVEAVSDGRYLLESDAPPFYVQWATLRDARTGAVLWRLEQPPGTRMGLSGGFDLLPDRFVAVLGNANGLAGGLSAVQMVDKATGTPLWSAAITAESVTGGAQLTPDGKFLILPCRTGQDAMLFAFAAADGRRAAEIRWPAGTRLRNWTLSPDGRTIAVVHGREVRLHRTETGETLHRLTGYADAVSQALFSPDGGRLFCTTGEAPIGGGPTAPTRVRLHVWDPHTGRELLALPVSGRLTAVDGGRLVGLTGPDGRPVDGTPAVKP